MKGTRSARPATQRRPVGDAAPAGAARSVVVTVGLGVVLRLLLLAASGDLEPHADESHYLYSALFWNHFGFYADSILFLWPPGFPLALATAIDWFGARGPLALKLAQVLASGVIGAATALLAYRLFSLRAAWIAGGLWAVYLPLAAYTHYLWPETLFAAFFVPALYLLVRWWQEEPDVRASDLRLCGAGLLLGAALLLKEVALYLCPLVAVLAAWRLRRRPLPAAQAGLLFALPVAVVILPVSLHNQEVYGRLVPLGVTLGKNLSMGLKHPYRSLDFEFPGELAIYEQNTRVIRRVLGETGGVRVPDFPPDPRANLVDHSRAVTRDAVAFGLAHPKWLARSRLLKIASFAAPTSFFLRHYALDRYRGVLDRPAVRRSLVTWAVLSAIAVMACAIPGLLWSLPGRAGGLILVTVLVYFCVTGAPIQGASRYRVPIEPVLIVLASGFLSGAGRPWLKRRLAAGAVLGAWLALAGLWWIDARSVAALLRVIW